MKASYLFAPIRQMFNFKGTSTRAEFFTYAIPSALVGLLVIAVALLEPILSGINWYVFMPAEMVNDRGLLWEPLDLQTLTTIFYAGLFITQFPMIALSVRRLNDQYAAWPAYFWLFVPFIGPLALFFYAFYPTFVDYEVTVNGERMMRSEHLSKRRFRNTVIGGFLVVGGMSALTSALSVGNIKLEGGSKVRVNRKMSGLKADGSMNADNNIWARTKGHVRAGKSVTSYGGKYTK
jgi:uncharacterized membrane protein YhaH (DUF805 family)